MTFYINLLSKFKASALIWKKPACKPSDSVPPSGQSKLDKIGVQNKIINLIVLIYRGHLANQ